MMKFRDTEFDEWIIVDSLTHSELASKLYTISKNYIFIDCQYSTCTISGSIHYSALVAIKKNQ